MPLTNWTHRRRRPLVASLGAVIVATALTAAVALAVGVEDDDAPAAPAGPTIPPVTKGSRVLPTVDLAALIVPTPDGFPPPIPDDQIKVAGKVDVGTVVQDRTDPEGARQHLVALGFTDAFVRSWQKPNNSPERLTVRLYQFDDEKGAVEYAKGSVRQLQKDHADAQVASVPGTDAIAVDVREQDGLRLVYVFGRRGRVTMVIAAVLPPPVIDAVSPVARQQLSLLPG